MTAVAPDQAGASNEGFVAHRLGQGLLGLAGLGVVGTAAELAAIRHWQSTEQLIPWAVLSVMAAAILAVALRPTGSVLRGAGVLSLGTLVAGAYGVVEHVSSNLESGPLDRVYGPKWDSMGTLSRWWAAANGGVGPNPVLAPAVLAQIGLCLLLATWAHHALHRSRPRPAGDA